MHGMEDVRTFSFIFRLGGVTRPSFGFLLGSRDGLTSAAAGTEKRRPVLRLRPPGFCTCLRGV